MCEHILIGAGAFGLGFSGDLFSRSAKLKTVIISRDSSTKALSGSMPPVQSVVRDELLTSKQEYRVRYGAEAHNVKNINLINCNFREPSSNVISHFLSPLLKLITIAVPESGLEDVAILLSKGFAARYNLFPSINLPLTLTFVNTPNNGQKLRGHIARNSTHSIEKLLENEKLAFPNCVIDRICSGIEFDDEGVLIEAEQYASLITEKSQYTQFLDEYNFIWEREYGGVVLRLVKDMRPWELLKYWGLNGMHLLLGSISETPIYGNHKIGSNHTVADIISDARVSSLMEGFWAEVSLAIRTMYPDAISRDDIFLFFSSLRKRLEKSKDTNSRLLKDLRLDRVTVLSDALNEIDFEDKNALDNATQAIIEKSIGEFLKKLDIRMLHPTFHLSGTEKLYPLNLAIGTSCALHAMAKQTRK